MEPQNNGKKNKKSVLVIVLVVICVIIVPIIIVTVMLISLGILMFNNASQIAMEPIDLVNEYSNNESYGYDNPVDHINELAKGLNSSRYKMYEGEGKSIGEVRSLLNNIKADQANENLDFPEVVVALIDADGNTIVLDSLSTSRLNANSKYDVVIDEYDIEGYATHITIKETK